MFDPQNETDPTIAANSVGISDFSTHNDPPKMMAVLDPGDDRHRPAADPVEDRHHLRHRGHPHVRAAGTPTAVPITSPRVIKNGVPDPLNTCGVSSVATIAIAIPTAAILFPRIAVRGPVSPLIP